MWLDVALIAPLDSSATALASRGLNLPGNVYREKAFLKMSATLPSQLLLTEMTPPLYELIDPTMKTRILFSYLFSIALLGTVGSAGAATIDCMDAGCLGGVYTLDITSVGGDSYLATYTIDTSGTFNVAATTLNDAEFKVANDYSNVSVLSGPSGVVRDGPLSGRGCVGSNETFLCVDLDPELEIGGVYSWEIQFDSTAILYESEWHIGARYTSPSHQTGWVISETGSSPVPEPTSALLLGAGLLAASAGIRRD
jgi:hypothetical protein